MKDETTIYPTDILRSKYVTVLQASISCNVPISKILELIKNKSIPYAEFRVGTNNRSPRVTHVNPEDIQRVLLSGGDKK